MPTRRHYIDNAPTPTFGPVGTTDTAFALSSAVGQPALFPYTATLGLGTASQENVLVTAITGSTVTVTRNYDGLGAFSHPTGETFNHTAVAIDYDEANAHTSASSGVHGITGAVVGTTDTQTLSNKTFAGLSLTASSVVGLTVTGDNTSDLADFKQGSTTVAKVDKDGKLTAAQINTAGTLAAGATTITGNETVSGTFGATGNSTFGGTLGITGNTTVGGTLGTTGKATLASAEVTGTTVLDSTLSVAGATTAHDVSVTTLETSGLATLASGSVTGALAVGGQLTLVSPPTIQVFTTSGTWTKPTGLVAARIRATGAGGGSGGNGGSAGQAASGAGAGGGYCEAYITAANLGATESVTVGVGGVAGTTGGGTGSTGGNTTFGSHFTASGGLGGVGATTVAGTAQVLGGVGGAATGADINIQGGTGLPGIVAGGTALFLAQGGSNPLGNSPLLGIGGQVYGSGASGVISANAGLAGQAGAPGVVIVECFFS